MHRCTLCACKSVVQFFLLERLELRLELVLSESDNLIMTGSKLGTVSETYLVNLITHSDGVGDGIGNFVCEVHLFSDRVHRLVDLVDVAG
jgi:hypothetical protein